MSIRGGFVQLFSPGCAVSISLGLLPRLQVITSVSGGSILLRHLVLHGQLFVEAAASLNSCTHFGQIASLTCVGGSSDDGYRSLLTLGVFARIHGSERNNLENTITNIHSSRRISLRPHLDRRIDQGFHVLATSMTKEVYARSPNSGVLMTMARV